MSCTCRRLHTIKSYRARKSKFLRKRRRAMTPRQRRQAALGQKKYAMEKTFQESMQSGDRAKRVPGSTQIDIGKHITMIRNHAAEKNLQGAFSVFKSLEEGDVELNSVIHNTVLDACVECWDLKKAESWMERM